jgi:hypothetical protein
VIITAGRLGEQLCWSEPWTEFSARTVLRVLAVTGLDTVVPVYSQLDDALAAAPGGGPGPG